ncbi:MAG: hypothetical protein ACRCSV_05665 [Chlamydiales bacterium]
MKIASIVVIIYLLIPVSSYSLNASKFFNALETNNIGKILRKIDINSTVSIKEISKFFEDSKEICEVRYGVSISLFQVQQDILEICKQNMSNVEDFFTIERFIAEVFDPKNTHSNSQYISLASARKKKFFFEEKNIPIHIIFGCIEIGCGILLWLTPFKSIGNILISDGCRRMLNEVEIIGKTRNYHHNMFQKLANSGTILYKL